MAAQTARVAAAAASTLLTGFLSERKRLTLFNDSPTGSLKFRLGAPVTALVFTDVILPGGTRVLTTRDGVYGLWDVVDGAAVITEEF